MTLTRQAYLAARNGDGTSPTSDHPADVEDAEPADTTAEQPEEAARVCPVCGKPVVGDRRRTYCSVRCSKRAKVARARGREPAIRKKPAVPETPPRAGDSDGLMGIVGQLLAVAGEVELQRDGWRVIARAR